MPTYEYECKKCKYRFDEFQGINDKHRVSCPKCKKKSLQRLIGRGSMIVFKGKGFYETDYNGSSTRS